MKFLVVARSETFYCGQIVMIPSFGSVELQFRKLEGTGKNKNKRRKNKLWPQGVLLHPRPHGRLGLG